MLKSPYLVESFGLTKLRFLSQNGLRSKLNKVQHIKLSNLPSVLNWMTLKIVKLALLN